jgi:hypothetical protein
VEIVLFAVALFLIIAAGGGIAIAVYPRHRPANLSELLCLSFLLGASFVSLASFALGFFLTGSGLRLTVAALCLALLALGLRANPRQIDWRGAWPAGKSEWALLGLTLSLISLAAWLSHLRALGWDGLLNWEIKARIAFLNGGAIPLSFYSDPTRPWTHPEYPLLLPLTESWLYSWLGSADQAMVKILFPVFFAASLGLLHAGVRRFGARPAQLWLAPAMLATTPLILAGEGGVASGYADFPLAVFYLAAVIFLLEYLETGDAGALRLFGLLAAACGWLKREGAILWVCLIALAMIGIIRRREFRQTMTVVLPGLALLIGWRIFLVFARPSSGNEFLPLTPSTLRDNLWRAPRIAQAALQELLSLRRWGILWVAALLAALFLILSRQREYRIVLPLAVVVPVALYSGIFLFSAWNDFLLHLNNTFPRLLIQVSLAAALMVAVAAPIGRRRDKDRRQ